MWATSIGLTFAHSPVPGERKSGMPDGTEMPAPVSATTEPARSIRRASVVAAAVSVALTRAPSLATEPRAALLEERRDPLAGVLGGEHVRERLLLLLDARVDVDGTGHALDLLDRQRRLFGQLARPGQRGIEQLLVGDDVVGQAERVGLVG